MQINKYKTIIFFIILSTLSTITYSQDSSVDLELTTEQKTNNIKEEIPSSNILNFSEATYIPIVGAFGDSLSTQIALNQSGVHEANSLINTSSVGLIGLFALKTGIIYYLDQQQPEVRKPGLKVTAGIWSGVTLNNLLIIAGASNPVSIIGGIVFGIYMYNQEDKILEAQEIKNLK